MILAAAVLLLTGTAACEELSLLEDEGLSLVLLAWERTEGQVLLTLRFVNRHDCPRSITLFAPTANGLPASFLYGWPSEEIALSPLKTRDVVTTLYADNPAEWIDCVSFRLIEAGTISSQATIDFQNGAVSAATYGWQSQEEQLLLSVTSQELGSSILLKDALSAAEVSNLDYGQLCVCLRITRDQETLLVPFTFINATVTPDGQVSAEYSGNAVVCSAAPSFPLQVEETPAGDSCLYTVRDLTLSGPFVFYSTLELQIQEDRTTQTVHLLSCSLSSYDTGPLNTPLPLALFDTLALAHPAYRHQRIRGALQVQEADVLSCTQALDTPLSFTLVPANTLGEIVAYFEYFFLDGSDVVHPTISLE